MQTKQNIKLIKETFQLGLKGIFSISSISKTLFSNWINISPIFLSILTFFVANVLNLNYYELIVEAKNVMLDFLPDILGFTIAGYSIVVGFVQAGMMNKISEPFNGEKYSFYQKMSSTFAINILILCFALIVAYTFHFIIFIDLHDSGRNLALNVEFFNCIGLFIIFYWFYFSLLMTIQIVVNIFDFSQVHHMITNKEKIDTFDKSGK